MTEFYKKKLVRNRNKNFLYQKMSFLDVPSSCRKTRVTGDQRKIQDHPDHSIVEIIEKKEDYWKLQTS